MGKMGETAGGKNFAVRAKACDTCNINAALLFCRTDTTYLCMDCDSKIHGNNNYERVWMCEVCEQAPSSVTCKADAAALCAMCDWDIHSANPLAGRHHRVPVTPFYHSAVSVTPESEPNLIGYKNCNQSLCEESKLSGDMKSLEFNYPVPLYGHDDINADSVVPVQINAKPAPQPSSIMRSVDNHFEIDFTTPNISSSYQAPSISQNISSGVGIVPDGSCMSDTSYPFAKQMNSTNNTGNGQVSVAMDREARVMRYREKRKNRKFQNTIRYASRKAFAETRPRIKGRFVKRMENTEDVQGWFTSVPATTNFINNSGFGVVPSF